MKRLILMRHAKSDWSDMAASDHARPLNARGRQSAAAVGRWMREAEVLPDHILCSDAARTRETLSLLALEAVPISLNRSLYLAEPEAMLRALHTRQEDCIMLIGHNPGCAMLAERLVPEHHTQDGIHAYPTGATLVVDFDIAEWVDLDDHAGRVAHFVLPRALMK
jgi:phosphohistidine phosphatase